MIWTKTNSRILNINDENSCRNIFNTRRDEIK